MVRSIWKGPFCDFFLIQSVFLFFSKNMVIKTFSRNSVILPIWVGLVFFVYNGLKFCPIFIKESMVGFKLGEFIFTRKKALHIK